jgi:hypothetical protein
MKKRRKWQPHVDVFIFSIGWCIQRIPHPSFSSGISSLFSFRWPFDIANYFGDGFLYWPCRVIIAVVERVTYGYPRDEVCYLGDTT